MPDAPTRGRHRAPVLPDRAPVRSPAHAKGGGDAAPRRPRRLDVQGLRAVAVLLVVVFHAGLPVPGGFIGVDVFFVISGYVIIALLYYEVERDGSLHLGRFFERRVRRILPALSLLSTLTVVAAWFWLSPLGTQQVTATTARAAALLYANWSIMATTGDYFAEAAAVNPLLHTWSLSVEEQFYLVFPSLLLGMVLLSRRLRWPGRGAVLAMLGALAVVSFLIAWWFTGPLASSWPNATGWAFYGSFFRAWEFAVGGLLAVAVRNRPMVPRAALTAVGVGGLAVVAVGAFVIDGSTTFPGGWTLVPVLGTAAVIYAGSGTGAGLVPGLASAPMVWLGDLSYSWYLWHWPAIVFTAVLTEGSATWVLVAAFGSLVPAWLSYRLLEEPVRHSGLRGRRAVVLGAACMVIPVVAATGLLVHANRAVGGAVQTVEAGSDWTIGQITTDVPAQGTMFDKAVFGGLGQWQVYDEPCLMGRHHNTFGRCQFFTGADRPRLLVVGDSHAGADAPGVLVAARELGYQVEVNSVPGCPVIGVVIARAGQVQRECDQHMAQFWRYVEADPPDVVVIANRSPRYVSPTVPLADELGGEGAPDPCVYDRAAKACFPHDEAVTVWQAALLDTARRLESLGTSVVVQQTAPELARAATACVRGTSVDLPCLETPRDLTWQRRVDVVTAEQQAADQAGFLALDPFEVFCGETTCGQYLDGWFRYRNDDHLNPAGAELLVPALMTALQSIGDAPAG